MKLPTTHRYPNILLTVKLLQMHQSFKIESTRNHNSLFATARSSTVIALQMKVNH